MIRRIRILIRRFERRCTRGRRFALACRAWSTRADCLPDNRWDMSEAEHNAYVRAHDRHLRNYDRLKAIGQRWGYQLR